MSDLKRTEKLLEQTIRASAKNLDELVDIRDLLVSGESDYSARQANLMLGCVCTVLGLIFHQRAKDAEHTETQG